MTDPYPQIIEAIVKSQEEIIGPMAWQQAASVDGIVVTEDHRVSLTISDRIQVINDLVMKFHDFFGQAAIGSTISYSRMSFQKP
jgi:hypothetical protein